MNETIQFELNGKKIAAIFHDKEDDRSAAWYITVDSETIKRVYENNLTKEEVLNFVNFFFKAA